MLVWQGFDAVLADRFNRGVTPACVDGAEIWIFWNGHHWDIRPRYRRIDIALGPQSAGAESGFQLKE
jgi:hypothetical protein